MLLLEKVPYTRPRNQICDFCNENYILCNCDLPLLELEPEYHEHDIVYLDQQ